MKKPIFLSCVLGSFVLMSACGGSDSGSAGDGDGDGDVAGDGEGDGDGDVAGDGDGDAAGDGDGDAAGDGDGDVGGDGDGDGDAVGDGDGDVAGDGDGDGDLGGAGGGENSDPSTPTCTIISPTEGADLPYSGFSAPAFVLEATAEDAEDGDLAGSSVVWTASGIDAPLGSGLEVDVEELPPGDYDITCMATDSDDNTGSSTVAVTVISPVAQVFHPGAADGPRVQGSDFPFSGGAMDYEDGQLDTATFEWSSSIDGALGNPVDSTNLSVGTHTISMTATDSDDNEAVATVEVILE